MNKDREHKQLSDYLSKDFILIHFDQTLKDANALLKEKGGNPEWVMLVRMADGNLRGAPFKAVSEWLSEAGGFDLELTDLLQNPNSPLADILTVDKFEDDLGTAQQLADKNIYGLCAITAFEDVIWIFRSGEGKPVNRDHQIHVAQTPSVAKKPSTGASDVIQKTRNFYNRYRVGLIFGAIWFILTAIVSVGIPLLKINLSDVLPSMFPPVMTGEWNLVVTGFTPGGKESVSTSDARHISDVFYNHFANEIETLGNELGVYVEIIGPSGAPQIKGETPQERERRAANLADRMKADLVIYGTIERSGSGYLLRPEFYVNVRNFYEASEMVGRHTLGSEIRLSGVGEQLTSQINLNRELSNRSEVLALITKGLGMFVTHQYDYAFDLFSRANDDVYWDIDSGREVIYLFQGNAALRANNLDQAQEAYRNALRISPDYSRAYIGLGSYYYVSSLLMAKESGSAPDIEHLNTALENYELALEASNQPASADIPAKVAFGRGQVYLTSWIYGSETEEEAQNQFEFIIAQYGDGENIRLQEMASESHANLGLIAKQKGEFNEALDQYTLAVELATNPSRRGLYWKILGNLYGITGDTEESQIALTNCVTEYMAAIKLTNDPGRRASSFINISKCYEGLENYDDAVFALDQAIDYLPQDSPLLEEIENHLEELEAKQ